MKRQLIYSIALATALVLTTGCAGRSGRTAGDAAAQHQAVEVDSLLCNAAQLAGSEVTVEGICTHICSHGGRKIFLMGADQEQLIRIEAGKDDASFDPECVNNLVRVTGTLVEERMDEAYLTGWEQQLRAQTAEQHGQDEAGCSTEQKARGEAATAGPEQRIAALRARIAKRQAAEGKEYLSFYYIRNKTYEVLK